MLELEPSKDINMIINIHIGIASFKQVLEPKVLTVIKQVV